MSEQVLDYAIVGGGISGLYSAWRLKEADSTLSIKVFESSDRVGGRLLTVTPPKMPDSRVELGGMRYIVEEHHWVNALVKHLKLETEALPADEPTNIAYLRGKLLRMFELTDPTKIPYNVAPNEQDPGILANLTGQAAALSLAPTIQKLLGITGQELEGLEPLHVRAVADRGQEGHLRRGTALVVADALPHDALDHQRGAGPGRGRRRLRQHPLHVECRRRFRMEPRRLHPGDHVRPDQEGLRPGPADARGPVPKGGGSRPPERAARALRRDIRPRHARHRRGRTDEDDPGEAADPRPPTPIPRVARSDRVGPRPGAHGCPRTDPIGHADPALQARDSLPGSLVGDVSPGPTPQRPAGG